MSCLPKKCPAINAGWGLQFRVRGCHHRPCVAQLGLFGALARMKSIRARLVISWLLFAAFLAALWLHFYTVAGLVIFPAIVLVRLHIPRPQLSALERRASTVAAVIIIAFFGLLFFRQEFPPALVKLAQIVGTFLVLAYGIFTDHSTFKQAHDTRP